MFTVYFSLSIQMRCVWCQLILLIQRCFCTFSLGILYDFARHESAYVFDWFTYLIVGQCICISKQHEFNRIHYHTHIMIYDRRNLSVMELLYNLLMPYKSKWAERLLAPKYSNFRRIRWNPGFNIHLIRYVCIYQMENGDIIQSIEHFVKIKIWYPLSTVNPNTYEKCR